MPNKILQISHKPAYPAIDGGCLEIAKMSSFYDREDSISLSIFTIETHKHPFKKKAFEKNLTGVKEIESIFLKTKISFLQALLAVFSKKSYNLSRFKNKKVLDGLIQLLKKNEYDFIQFESIYTAQYAKELAPYTSAKFVINVPNVEHKLWSQHAEKAKGFKRIYLNLLAKQLQNEEVAIWKNMDAFICISGDIETSIDDTIKATSKIIIPFVINLEKYEPVYANKELSFFHIGAMDWRPNIEGINWLLNSIWANMNLNSKLQLAGKGDNKLTIDSTFVDYHGFVPNAIEFMTQHDVMLVPLKSGSGMRIKIIEAMALGKCVISTSLGAEGINCIPGKSILIANTVQEFTDAIQSLVTTPEKAHEIGREARKFIEQNHSLEILSEKLIPFLSTVSNTK